MSSGNLKIVSCIPEQRFSVASKLDWMEKTLKETSPDILVMPQEYFGGIQQELFNTDEPFTFQEDEILDPVLKLSSDHHAGIIFGALVWDNYWGENRERIYGIDPNKGRIGHFDKIHLPAYDHIGAGGKTRVSPERSLETRSTPMEILGARISVLFCWEVFSSYIWHAIARGNPDMVVSCIKFGIRGWPKKDRDVEKGQSLITGFGFGGDGGWLQRLKMASLYDVAAPIICSTNSWSLPGKSQPLCGTILPWESDLYSSSLHFPELNSTPVRDSHIVEEVINPLHWRYTRENKFTFNKHLGYWPESAARVHTMMWKVRRMERKLSVQDFPEDVVTE